MTDTYVRTYTTARIHPGLCCFALMRSAIMCSGHCMKQYPVMVVRVVCTQLLHHQSPKSHHTLCPMCCRNKLRLVLPWHFLQPDERLLSHSPQYLGCNVSVGNVTHKKHFRIALKCKTLGGTLRCTPCTVAFSKIHESKSPVSIASGR